MPNEYNSNGEIILRDSSGNIMSLAAFFKLALRDENNDHANPTDARAGHYAWDMGTGSAITVPARTPVFGTVIEVGDNGYNGGRGTYAIVRTDRAQDHHFYHMKEGSLLVTAGDEVSQGDTLGIIGNTGDSDGNHLHYQVIGAQDPINAFDCSTLPSGWTFADAVANGNNWDYIPLDVHDDYGPPGGDVPSEPYYPDKPCHDISWAQEQSGTINPCIDAIANAGHSGVIIQVGGIYNNGFVAASTFSPADAIQEALAQGLGLGIYFYNYGDYANDLTTAFQDALSYLETIGATPEKINLGVWLDTEYNAGQGYDPVPSADPAVNYSYVERFLNVFDAADYPVVGIYSSAANFGPWYGSSRIGDKPIWAAYWTGTFDTVDRSTLNPYLPEADYTKVYLMQYSSTGTVPGWSGNLDCVKVLSPMPTSGGGGGGGGGDYTEVIDVTVDIVPPKKIYFSPVPGLIHPPSSVLSAVSETITLTTDADNAVIYYTTDGSSPYQYTNDGTTTEFTLAANALLYSSSFAIFKDTHVRAVAVPEGTTPGSAFEKILARASGTYLFAYNSPVQNWESEQQSYATANEDTSFFEENRQAFLRLHNLPTEEEILYAVAYTHDTQNPEEDAKDNASTTGSTTPGEEDI